MYRYIAFVWNHQDGDSARIAKTAENCLRRPEKAPWSAVHESPGCLVLHAGANGRDGSAIVLSGARGVVLGTLFRRTDDPRCPQTAVRSFEEAEVRNVLETTGRHLIERYWGRYVAVLRDRDDGDAQYILRDPTGLMTCFRIRHQRVDVFFSHIEDYLQALPGGLSFNWEYLTARIIVGQFLNRQCALKEVEDIPGGEVLISRQGKESRKTLWHPGSFADQAPIEDAGVAQVALRDAAQATANAWTSGHEDVVLSLSGGLDSSVIAGLLANSPAKPRVHCFNYFLEPLKGEETFFIPNASDAYMAKVRRLTGHPDERRFARLVAARHGYTLHEVERRLDRIDMTQAWHAPLTVVPSEYMNIAELDAAESQLVRQSRATALFTGLGGDTVLYCSFQPLAAADYLFRHPLGGHLLREVSNAVSVSRESFWDVLGTAVKRGLLRRAAKPLYDPVNRPSLLTDEVMGSFDDEYVLHPWSKLCGQLPPGKKNHVNGISGALFYHHAYLREREAPSIHPLISQPVVELCLRIPTYVLLNGGVSRGLAREAFKDILPKEVYGRVSKGTGSTAQQQFISHNMPLIRERLLDGILVREGILDKRKLEDFLVPDQKFLTVLPSQVSDYVVVEGWLGGWTNHLRQQQAA